MDFALLGYTKVALQTSCLFSLTSDDAAHGSGGKKAPGRTLKACRMSSCVVFRLPFGAMMDRNLPRVVRRAVRLRSALPERIARGKVFSSVLISKACQLANCLVCF